MHRCWCTAKKVGFKLRSQSILDKFSFDKRSGAVNDARDGL